MGRDVALTVRRFHTRDIPADVWRLIRPLVVEAVERTKPRDEHDANLLLTTTAALFAWCAERGLPLTLRDGLDPITVNRFATEGRAHLSKGTRANTRSTLVRVGRSVLGPDVYPVRVPLSRSEHVRPYTRADVDALVASTRGLPSSAMRNGTRAILGLGLGAGLTPFEITRASGSWLRETTPGLVVEVPGEHARTVPVLRRWEPVLRDVLAWAGSGVLFMPKRTTFSKRQLSSFAAKLPAAPGVPGLNAQRLRVTWIVRLLDAAVPINVIAAVAGATARHISTYAECLVPRTSAEIDAAIRKVDG